MMTKKRFWIALMVGLLLLAASAVMTILAASQADIIGGVGLPTLRFYFHETGADWLAFVGASVSGIAGVLLLRRK